MRFTQAEDEATLYVFINVASLNNSKAVAFILDESEAGGSLVRLALLSVCLCLCLHMSAALYMSLNLCLLFFSFSLSSPP